MIEKRYLFSHIQKDLKSKMVFIGGARQAGKTTLALKYLKPASPKHPAYLNWDISSHQFHLLPYFLKITSKCVMSANKATSSLQQPMDEGSSKKYPV